MTESMCNKCDNMYRRRVMMQPISNERGSAYILVIILMLILFALSSTLLYISNNEILSASSYGENIGGYEAAVSGINRALEYLQKKVDGNRRVIDEKTLNEIFAAPLSDISFYLPDPADKYGGEFRLRPKTGTTAISEPDCLYHRLFTKYAVEALSDILDETCILSIRYSKESDDISYLVTVQLSEGFDNQLILKSVAVNEKTGVSERARAAVAFSLCDCESFTEKYPLDTHIPEYLSRGIYARGVSNIDTSSALTAPTALFNQDAELPYESFAGLASRSIVTVTGSSFDISLHKTINGDSPAVVIYGEGDDLIITASDPSYNLFEGIIISYGGIKLENTSVQIKGQIYCSANLNLMNSALGVEYKNMLPEISFDSLNEKREFLDKLGVINFDEAVSTLSGFQIGSLTLSDQHAGRLKIKSLTKSS